MKSQHHVPSCPLWILYATLCTDFLSEVLFDDSIAVKLRGVRKSIYAVWIPRIPV